MVLLVIAQTLHKEHCRIILNGRDSGRLQNGFSNFRSSGILAMATQADQANHLCGSFKYGHLDGLVCNVGSGRSASPGENLKEWHRICF